MSSQESSCAKPTWLASMKQGSHFVLQRLDFSHFLSQERLPVLRAAQDLFPCFLHTFGTK